MSSSAAIRIICFVVLCSISGAARAAAQQPVASNDADLGEAWQRSTALDAPRPAGGLAVDVRFAALRRAAVDGGVLALPLPDGRSVRFGIEWAQADAAQLLLAGRLVDADGDASLTVVGNALSARIVVGGRLFLVRRAANSNAHVVSEIDGASFPGEAEPVVADSAAAAASADPVPAGDTNAFVDVMVLYTPGARSQIGGTAAMTAELVGAVNNANLALATAGVVHRFRLVHYGEIAYTETGAMGVTLDRLRNPADGFMDGVAALRNTHRADVVSLLSTDQDACGIGYLMTSGNVTANFESLAFNVSLWSCANGNLTLAHEIGHNMGLHHDRLNAGSTPPSFPYAYGYAIPGLARDVMAYACATNCPRRTIFSTPLVNFPGTGVAAGTATEDNARALNGTSTVVANFRQSACTFSLSSSSAAFAPIAGAGAVSVTTSAGCGWSAVNNSSPFVTITGATGSGSGIVTYTVATNTGAARSATLTIAGAAFTVTQSARVGGADYDGDARSEIVVFRPSAGAFYVLRSSTDFTGGAGYAWGASTDVPVMGDFDGDGRHDIAVYRPESGHWFVLRSSTNFASSATYQWGTAGDKPVPADYDGDGRTDLAVYRPSSGTWYVLTSGSGLTSGFAYVWGAGTDVPLPGDYDGDLKADLVVFRPSSGHWFVLRSSSSYTASLTYQWGTSGDVPVPGNYDGDNRTDIAIYRPANGTWYVLTSSTNFTSGLGYAWGTPTDTPVPADFDGDGRTDIAVFRPSSGHWFILRSATGYSTSLTYQWGTTGDIPVLGRQ